MPKTAYTLKNTAPSWDIFCQVIDNWGDMGVCWRLARQLANDYHATVRLWLDDWEAFRPLYPTLGLAQATKLPTCHGQLTLLPWSQCSDKKWDEHVADYVVEGFGCTLPSTYLAAMAKHPPQQWFVMEYLSAEPWVDSVHGLCSRHPQLGLNRRFVYPGFSSRSGGLLRESNLLNTLNDSTHMADFCRRYDLPAPEDVLGISLFAYTHAPLPALLEAWVVSPVPVWVVVPQSILSAPIAAWAGESKLPTHWQRGQLTLRTLPLLAHNDYDTLLAWASINFVRGEDSFIRAQWAARPLIWHIYPQAEHVHEDKLNAWLTRYCAACPTPLATLINQTHLAWNRGQPLDWPRLHAQLTHWRAAAEQWCYTQAAHSDFARQLVEFCQTEPNG